MKTCKCTSSYTYLTQKAFQQVLCFMYFMTLTTEESVTMHAANPQVWATLRYITYSNVTKYRWRYIHMSFIFSIFFPERMLKYHTVWFKTRHLATLDVPLDKYSFSWVKCHLMILNQSLLVCDDMTSTWQPVNEKEGSEEWPISMHMHFKWVRKSMVKIWMMTAGVQTGSGTIRLRNTSHTKHCEAKLIWWCYIFILQLEIWRLYACVRLMFGRLLDISLWQ